jgi:RimJ/RimL family protein N-acetyltransferase
MIDYVYGHDRTVANFVSQLILPCRGRDFGNCSAIGVIDNDGKLIAGIVYHNYDVDAGVIETSVAALPGKNWYTRETIRRMYQYPFIQLRCQMTIMRVPADNVRLVRIAKALNYQLVTIPRLLGRNRDAVIGLLTYERWANNKFNQRYRHHIVEPIEEAA